MMLDGSLKIPILTFKFEQSSIVDLIRKHFPNKGQLTGYSIGQNSKFSLYRCLLYNDEQ